MSVRPPFVVPPENVNLWDKDFEREYNVWKDNDSNSKSNKEDYRLYIININKDYDMEEVFDKLEIGLEAFEKLIICTFRLPNYNLNEDLEKIYHEKENVIVKDFIKWGMEFVMNHQSVDLSQVKGDITTKGTKPDSIEDTTMSPEVDRINNQHMTPVAKEEVVGEMETDQTRIKSKRKKRKNKESRQRRLLKYHEKLVKTSGLPPSRLMEKQKHGPVQNHLKRSSSFQQSLLMVQHLPQPSMESNGTGWPEARPMLVLGSNTPQSTHMYCESTSGSQNQQSLSLSPQYSVGWPVGVPVYQPQLLSVQPGGRPAYCFHCFQFGTVYTIHPA